MASRSPDHTLEFLLTFDGRIHHLEQGYWMKFEIQNVGTTKTRPHGLSYSFCMHRMGRAWSASMMPIVFQQRVRVSRSGPMQPTIGIAPNLIREGHTHSRTFRP